VGCGAKRNIFEGLAVLEAESLDPFERRRENNALESGKCKSIL
jgi:hypothetical protein